MNNNFTWLAGRLALALRARWVSTTRAVFEGGALEIGREIAFVVDGVGAMFVRELAGRVIVDAAAYARPGEPRTAIAGRHRELLRWGKRLFTVIEIDGARRGSSTAGPTC